MECKVCGAKMNPIEKWSEENNTYEYYECSKCDYDCNILVS